MLNFVVNFNKIKFIYYCVYQLVIGDIIQSRELEGKLDSSCLERIEDEEIEIVRRESLGNKLKRKEKKRLIGS